MVINHKVTIELTPEDIKQAIIESLSKDGMAIDTDCVTFKVGSHSEGFCQGEHQVTTFDGAIISIKRKE